MKLHRLLPVSVSALVMAIALNAQAQNAGETVSDVSDLVGARGRDGEAQLQQRGYEFRWADESTEAVYTYWTQPGTGECITIRTEEGRYASIVYAGGTEDCDRGDPRHLEGNNYSSPPALQDLVGVRAGQAEGTLERRGYSFRRGEQVPNGSATFWVEGNSGQCVEIITSDGRYQEILYTEWYHCSHD